MCESNVYIIKAGREEILMEKVDRIVPAEDGSIFLESVFGERKVVRARILEMELVRHRIVLQDSEEVSNTSHQDEIWLEPATDHGHFHAGEEVRLKIFKGYNMKSSAGGFSGNLEAFASSDGIEKEIPVHDHGSKKEVSLGQEVDGLLQVWIKEIGERELYGKVIMEIGHHHHHGLLPIGLPLEIVPADYSHARMGASYGIQVLADGKPLSGAEVKVTYSTTSNREYPHRLTADAEGRAKIMLTARGNYLFSVTDGKVTSTFTLVKGI